VPERVQERLLEGPVGRGFGTLLGTLLGPLLGRGFEALLGPLLGPLSGLGRSRRGRSTSSPIHLNWRYVLSAAPLSLVRYSLILFIFYHF
jgi:hypothetical protein